MKLVHSLLLISITLLTAPVASVASVPDWLQWPKASGVWTLKGRTCAADGRALLAGPGTLEVKSEISDDPASNRFSIEYNYIHDRGLGDIYKPTYCSWTLNYQVETIEATPDAFSYRSGQMWSTGALCAPGDSPDINVKEEWLVNSWTFHVVDSNTVEIHTLNRELCTTDGVVFNRFQQ